jgi:hypothetical protein
MVFCKVVGFAIPEKWQSVQKKGQAETCPYPQRRVNENVYTAYHESLSSQAKSSRTYALPHKIMGAGIIAKEEQPDHYGNKHEKRMLLQNVLEIHRAAG